MGHQNPYGSGSSTSCYSSLFFRPTGSEIYQQLDSPALAALGHQERKVGGAESRLMDIDGQGPSAYRAMAAFPSSAPHSHYSSIAAGYAAAPLGPSATDWSSRGGDIYLRVGATLEIGTAAGLGSRTVNSFWHDKC